MGIRDQHAIPLAVPGDAMHFGIDDMGIGHPLKSVRQEKGLRIFQGGGQVFIFRDERLLHCHLRIPVGARNLAQVVGSHTKHIVHNGPAAQVFRRQCRPHH